MRNRKFWIFIFFSFILFSLKDVSAFSVDNYQYRNLCGNFEVARFNKDGSINTLSCHSDYNSAKSAMKKNGEDGVAILTKVNNRAKIIDANVALLDLSVSPEAITNFYNNSELTGSSYTYMDTGSLYGGVDGAHIDTAYSNSKNVWTAKVRTGNYTGWLHQDYYEIVPITWVKSSSSYTVTNDSIRHNYVAKIQNNYYGSAGSTIGPKPSMLSTGTYYSYDGHYFYKNLTTLIKDYKNGNYNNAVNKNDVYYNYYMYLSNHTKTKYSSTNIDEYIRNNMGIKQDVYGNDDNGSSSRLYGKGTFFYYAQEKYGVNAILALSLSRNETGNGRSSLSINKNNGFGLNAVDSNPYQAANWYANFASSVLGYASKWITYGYAHPRDRRYFGPQFGDKWIGMNVKYASDTYWSEKMAANYYSLDKAFGLQDYNSYQLGVVKGPTKAYREANTSSKLIYEYPEAEDGLVIVGEVKGQNVNGNTTWYKVISDLNIDSNYNEITSGDYNWNSYVYVPASSVKKINKAKNGYLSVDDITEYKDKYYTYDLLVENTEFRPKVGISTKATPYYYDATLDSKTGATLQKDRYVMVYTIAYENGNPVAYLVTSDYKYDQKEWISADSLRLVTSDYGKYMVNASGNQYTWVTSTTIDKSEYLIGGQYSYSYTPILEQKYVGNDLWYKVPVNLTGNNNVYGWTLGNYPTVTVEKFTAKADNNKPVINASNKTLTEGDSFNPLQGVTASDAEDGDLTKKIKVTENTYKNQAGTYKVVYEVVDSNNQKTTKEIKVTVLKNEKPVINAVDTEITINHEVKINVSATDKEDGDLTKKIKVVENTVDNKVLGTYKIVYEVTDSYNQTTRKEIKVTIVKDQAPVINAEDRQVAINSTFKELDNVSATDKEDGDLTKKIKVVENTVDTKKLGSYKVTYEVVDSYKNKTTKTIKIEVVEKVLTKKQGEFYLDDLSWNKTTKKYTFSGYLIILNANNNVSDVEYKLILRNIDTSKEFSLDLTPWTSKVPYDLGKENNYDYSKSWFKEELDLSNIELGDYELYVRAEKGDYYAEELVNNTFNRDFDKRSEDGERGYNFTVMLSHKAKEIVLNIRENLITTKTANTFRNMVNDYDDMKFVNNKLNLIGTSYNYAGTYAKEADISRKVIFENVDTYKRYTFDIGSTSKGSYKVTSSDNKDKSFAWYNSSVDIKDLEKGTYSIMIYTKTSDSEDYGEVVDAFAAINKASAKINNKNYEITLNKERLNRIELVVS